VEALVRREAAKLERYGQKKLVSCRVAIEQPQRHQQNGNRFRVRLFIGAGLQQPIVVARDPRQSDMHESLRTIVLGAFRAARRQLQSMTERRRGDTKASQEARALIVRLFPGASRGEGYGFLKTPDGRELYFHRNSVLHDDYERLSVGTEVRFDEEEGEKGPQASTVQIVSKPGVRTSGSGPGAIDPPRGWGGARPRRGGRRRRRAAA
jgi:cold shock CspA family protein